MRHARVHLHREVQKLRRWLVDRSHAPRPRPVRKETHDGSRQRAATRASRTDLPFGLQPPIRAVPRRRSSCRHKERKTVFVGRSALLSDALQQLVTQLKNVRRAQRAAKNARHELQGAITRDAEAKEETAARGCSR